MPFQSIGFRVMIASPSDLTEERKVATAVVQEWNAMHAVAEGVTLLPVMWETHAVPTTGIRPQEAVNEQLVKDSDLLVGMFWTRIGTNTGAAESGTVEEIDQFVAAGKPAMLYFSTRPVNLDKIDIEQHQKLKTFKAQTYQNALCGSFTSPEEFHNTLLRDLTRQIRQMKEAFRQQQEPAAGQISEATAPDAARDAAEQEAAEERDAFERKLIANTFRNFRARRGILALTIIPYNRPQKLLHLGEPFMRKYRGRFIPMGTTDGDHKPTPHSVITLYYDRDPEENRCMSELTTDGNIFAAWHWDDGDESELGVAGFPMYVYEPEVVKSIHRYLNLLNDLSVKGPWWVGLSLLNVRNFQLHPNRYMSPSRLRSPCTDDAIITDALRVEADAPIADPKAVAELFQHQLDQLWRGFGYIGDAFFDNENHYTMQLD